MTLVRARFLWLFALLFSCTLLQAEKVADLPMPASYVNDFAGVLTPEGRQKIEDLCLEVHQQAHAELVVVTVKSLDDDQSIEEFTVALEEKWKIGKKGDDRGALIVLSLNPHKFRIETGYGLEGILPDAKVGRIRDQATPFATAGNYDQALLTAVQGMADAIAADANVTLTPPAPAYQQHQYHREYQPAPQMSRTGRTILGLIVALVLFTLWRTGHIGWLFYLLLNMTMGGGGGGGGWGGGGGGGSGGGGGFGGSGGGESGGGGASGDF